ncbi:MAG TPA: hypothetical protein VK427_27020, partial [Kofleriaceae bacterium]|nr:hypothetical protein [Kofleriaceae bacterium]
MTTPVYQGPNQPPAERRASWLDSLGMLFGGSPVQYAAPPKASDSAKDRCADPARACVVDPCTFPIDPAALAAGQIAIVIPRSLISAIDPAALA